MWNRGLVPNRIFFRSIGISVIPPVCQSRLASRTSLISVSIVRCAVNVSSSSTTLSQFPYLRYITPRTSGAVLPPCGAIQGVSPEQWDAEGVASHLGRVSRHDRRTEVGSRISVSVHVVVRVISPPVTRATLLLVLSFSDFCLWARLKSYLPKSDEWRVRVRIKRNGQSVSSDACMRSGEPACRVPSRLRGGKFLGPSSQSFSLRSQSAPRIGDRKAERKKAAGWHLPKASRKVRGIVGRGSHGGRRSGVIAGGDHRGFEWVGRAPVGLPGTSWTRCPRATSVTGNVSLASRQHQAAAVILRSDCHPVPSVPPPNCHPRRRRLPLCISATTTALCAPSSALTTTPPPPPQIRVIEKLKRRPPCLHRRNIVGASTPTTHRNFTAIVVLRRSSGECIHLWYRLFSLDPLEGWHWQSADYIIA